MKRIAAILIVLLFAFQSAGIFLLFQIKQQEIRSEIKHRIKQGVPAEELVILNLPNSLLTKSGDYFRWIHEGEFIYHKQLYDIVKRIPGPESTTFHCIPDHEETRLFRDLDHMVNREMGKDKSRSGKIQMAFNLFLLEISPLTFWIKENPVSSYSHYSFISLPWSSATDLPPPKMMTLFS